MLVAWGWVIYVFLQGISLYVVLNVSVAVFQVLWAAVEAVAFSERKVRRSISIGTSFVVAVGALILSFKTIVANLHFKKYVVKFRWTHMFCRTLVWFFGECFSGTTDAFKNSRVSPSTKNAANQCRSGQPHQEEKFSYANEGRRIHEDELKNEKFSCALEGRRVHEERQISHRSQKSTEANDLAYIRSIFKECYDPSAYRMACMFVAVKGIFDKPQDFSVYSFG